MTATGTASPPIRLHGSVGVPESLDLRIRLSQLTAVPRPHISMDLTQVSQLHLAAVNCLVVAAVETTAAAGSLSIVATPGPVHDLLELAGLGGWIR